MYGDKASELVKELKRIVESDIPLFKEDTFGQVIKEISDLYDQNCLEVYHRLMHIRDLRWTTGAVLPAGIKANLTPDEEEWFTLYSQNLAAYKRRTKVDINQYMSPPKSLLIEVRCLEDYGELVLEDGKSVLLKKNTQHHLPRSACEDLIRQGVLEHVV